MKSRLARWVVGTVVVVVAVVVATVWYLVWPGADLATPVVILVVLAIFSGAALVVWRVPRRQVSRWRAEGIDGKDLAELGIATRTTLIQAIGGLALIATVALTAYQANEARRSSDRNLEVAQEAQATELLSRAISQLGAMTAGGEPALDVRIGAIYSLARVASLEPPTSELEALRFEAYAPQTAGYQVTQILQSYIRVNLAQADQAALKVHREPCSREAQRSRRTLRADLIAAFGILADLVRTGDDWGASDNGLSGLDLSGYVVSGIPFPTGRPERTSLFIDNISFRNADLTGFEFGDTSLLRADFRGACLRNADLELVTVYEGGEADFRGADLTGAALGDREGFLIDDSSKE